MSWPGRCAGREEGVGSRKPLTSPVTGSRGFTLIELLVVVSLLGIVSLAIYGTLSGGIQISKYLSSEKMSNDLVLDWMRLEQDLRGTLTYQSVPFVGKEGEVSFPVLVAVRKEGEDFPRKEVGQIRYYRDGSSGSLCREVLTGAALKGGSEGECRPVFTSAANASFEYYGGEEEKGPGLWRSEWFENFLPVAVRLNITTEGDVEKKFTTVLP